MTASCTLVEPAFASQPVSRGTLGPEVADISRLAGFDPDPEQQLALDALFAFDADGRSAAFELAVIASRQNMKTGLFKMAVLGWLFVTEQRLIVWSAHEMKTTKEAFRDLENLIAGCPPLKSRLAGGPSEGIHRGNGEESIELASGQRVMFKARTNGGGRGLTGDKVILDEAFALEPSHMASLIPTLSAVPDPQVVYGSSAGLAKSAVLRGIRDRGRVGGRRLAYFEWCAPEGSCAVEDCDHKIGTDGCALDDPVMWQRSNPAMGRRISEDYIRGERETFASMPLEFARERLGWWDKPLANVDGPAIDLAVWANLADREVVTEGLFMGLAVSRFHEHAAITMAGRREDGRLQVDVVECRPGSAWLPKRAIEVFARNGFTEVVLDPSSSAATAVQPLIEAEVPVRMVDFREYAQACSTFMGLIETGGLRHSGQPELDLAVGGSAQRAYSNTWVWDQRNSAVDHSPLVGGSLAVWAAGLTDGASVYDDRDPLVLDGL